MYCNLFDNNTIPQNCHSERSEESQSSKNDFAAYRPGFTLVEALLATLIAALVIVLALATYRSLSHNTATVQYHSDAFARGRYALSLIRNDLANFYRCADPTRMRLIGTRNTTPLRSADRLIFYSVADPPTGTAKPYSDVYEVEYGLSYREQKDRLFLARRCAPVADQTQGNPAGTLTRVAGDLDHLRFEYLHRGQWLDRWDRQTALPDMVRTTIHLADPTGTHEPIPISQVISLKPLPTQTQPARKTDLIDAD